MKRVFIVLSLLLASLAGCQPEEVSAKTQVTVRVHSSDQRLLDAITAVRLSLFRNDPTGWVQRGGTTAPRDAIRWPLDVPVTPSGQGTVDREFEVIVEAWAGEMRLAQTRAVTKFVPGSVRLVEVWLSSCGEHDLGFVCAEADCHGEACAACDSGGQCRSVGFTSADSPYNTSEQPAVKPPPMTVAGLDGGGGLDAGLGVEVDSAVQSPDATVVVMPTACAPACPSTADCVTSNGAPHCVCHAGYQEVAGTCEDIDECKLGTHGCSEHATCQNTVGSRECDCQDGFIDAKGDGTQCTDKCTGACDPHAACTVLDGKINCQCSGAYTGDGKTCTANPSCQMLNCGANSQCELTPGTTNTYRCSCLAGYQLVAGKCEDINECQLTPAPCGTGASCTNTPGSRTCTCLTGYQKNANTGACENVDDCKQKPCMNGGVCSDLVNDFSCACTSAFTGKQCQTNTPDCPTGACTGGTCVDGVGTYSCTCNAGYRPATGNKACTQILCTALSDPGNGSVSPVRAVGQTAMYTCNSGYGISSGSQSRMCMDDGTGNGIWTGTAATCALACTISGSCKPGDACSNSPDCGANNVCAGGRCLIGSCSGGTFASAAEIQSLQYCSQINGDLTISVGASGPARIDLPNTSQVLGNLRIQGSVENITRTVTLGALKSISGILYVGPASAGVSAGASKLDVSLPVLTRVDSNAVIALAPALSSLNLASLVSIGGSFLLEYLDNLQTLRVDSLTSVGTEITTIALPNAPWSPAFSRMASSQVSAQSKSLQQIGCCLSSNAGPDCTARPTTGCLQ